MGRAYTASRVHFFTCVPRSTAFLEAISSGALVGLLHAIFETALLGFYGVRLTALDLAIVAVASVSAASALGFIAAIIALSPPARVVLRSGNEEVVFRAFAWCLVIVGYILIFVKTVSYWSGWGQALKLAALALPMMIGASLAVWRKGGGILVLLWASACVALTLCCLQLADAAWVEIPAEKHFELALGLLTLVGSCLGLLAWLVKVTPPNKPLQPAPRGAAVAAVVVGGWIVLWPFVFSEPSALLIREDPRMVAGSRASGPNILLVVLDTVRADHLDLFGYERETMPNLRRFATQECQFAGRMFTTAPWTLPSHASMFTGLYSSAHGAHSPFVSDNDPGRYAYELPDDIPTLAEFLNELGYQTAAIAGNYGVLSGYNVLRGFSYRDLAPGAASLASRTTWLYRFRVGSLSSLGELLLASLPVAVQQYSVILNLREPPYRRAREITAAAQNWLERNGERPFFLFLNYFDAHQPYLPAPEDDERFVKRPVGSEWLGFPSEQYLAHRQQKVDFTREEEEFLIGQYDAELVTLDREFARLVDLLKSSGHFENTLIFVTTDHGESLFEHDLLEHGNSLYQPEIGGFLLIKAPPSLGAIKPSPLMQFVDFFPTIAAVLDEPISTDIQGLPWGQGRDYALSELFCRNCRSSRQFGQWPEFFRRELVAVVVDDLKMIRSTRDPDEFHDLAVNPKESNPLEAPDSQRLEAAEKVIKERNERLVRSPRDDPENKDVIQKLRSLGYTN